MYISFIQSRIICFGAIYIDNDNSFRLMRLINLNVWHKIVHNEFRADEST